MKHVVFHQFSMGDVDDPEIYIYGPINKWQQTDMGKWVMEHCAVPIYSIGPDNQTWGHCVKLYGMLEDKDATFFELKWGQPR